jgi:TonB family protein
MTPLIDIVVRPSIVLLAGFALAAVLGRRSAAARHAALAAAILSAAVVMPLAAVLPAWPVRVPQAATPVLVTPVVSSIEPGAAAVAAAAELPVGGWLAIVWSAGACASAVLLLAGLVRVRWLEARARPLVDDRWHRRAAAIARTYGLRRRIALMQSRGAPSPSTWGLRRPRIMLPADAARWDEARITVVLAHELAHVQRRDWIVQMACELVRAIYWFNPLAWIACSRLRRESEQACDDMVLGLGVAPGEYADHLLQLARRSRASAPRWAPVIPMARRSSLEGRIVAMLNARLDRRARSARSLALAAAALVAVALPAAALRAAQNGPLPLAGSLYDASGAVMPDVTLTLEDARGVAVQATTDGAGRFEFSSVAPGSYVLETSIPGFKKLRQTLELRQASDWTLDLTLPLGTVQETITVSGRRLTPAGAPRQAGAAAPVRVGGNVRPPRKLRDVRPVYPETLREAGVEGIVSLEAVIGKDGATASVRALSARVHPELAKAAIDAVRQWRFDPTLLNGQPVDVVMTVSVEFRLSDEE